MNVKELIENISSIIGLMAKFITGIGIAVLFSYCFFNIHFFPTGLSVGDSLIFIFSAMGFGIFYLFWLSLGSLGVYFLIYPFSRSLGKDDNSNLGKCVTFIIGFAFIFSLGFLWFKTGEPMSMLAPVASGIIILMVTSFWKTKPERHTETEIMSQSKVRLVLFIFALLLPVLLATTATKLIVSSSIQNIGIRKYNVSLILSKENYSRIENVAKELNIPLFGCSSDSNKYSLIVHNVNVLWHGIGENSLVELSLPTSQDKETVARVELDSKGVKILEIENPLNKNHNTIKSCFNLNTDTLFDTYSSNPNQIGAKRLSDLMKKIAGYTKEANLNVDSVSITGYTDQAPVLKIGDSNIDLSNRRAEAVEISLANLFTNLSKENININGNGAMSPKSNCGDHLSRAGLNECRAIDRRVEIEFMFSRKQPDTRNSH